MSGRVAMLSGGSVNRIHWQVGTDLLVAVCFCGAERTFDDPVALWEWLLDHPDGHRPADADPVPAERHPVAVGR